MHSLEIQEQCIKGSFHYDFGTPVTKWRVKDQLQNVVNNYLLLLIRFIWNVYGGGAKLKKN